MQFNFCVTEFSFKILFTRIILQYYYFTEKFDIISYNTLHPPRNVKK